MVMPLDDIKELPILYGGQKCIPTLLSKIEAKPGESSCWGVHFRGGRRREKSSGRTGQLSVNNNAAGGGVGYRLLDGVDRQLRRRPGGANQSAAFLCNVPNPAPLAKPNLVWIYLSPFLDPRPSLSILFISISTGRQLFNYEG
jgi:hypothetical protein